MRYLKYLLWGGNNPETEAPNSSVIPTGTNGVVTVASAAPSVVAPGTSGNALTSNGTVWQSTAVLNQWLRTTSTTGTTVLTSTSTTVQNGDTSGGTVNYTLPIASTCTGKIFTFTNIAASGFGAVVIAPGGADVLTDTTFASAANVSITGPLGMIMVQSDGTSWRTVKQYNLGPNFNNVTGQLALDPFAYQTDSANSTEYVYVNSNHFGTGTFTYTLDTAANCDKKVFRFKNVGTGVITIVPNVADTIDGLTTYTLGANQVLVIQAQGSANVWRIWVSPITPAQIPADIVVYSSFGGL